MLALWDSQKLPELIKEIKSQRKLQTMLVYVENEDESFIAGNSAQLIGHLLSVMDTICTKTGESLESILTQVLRKIEEKEQSQGQGN